MRIVIQRVNSASVTVDNQLISNIGKGLLCLIGIGLNDTERELKWGVDKILKIQLFNNQDDKPWKQNVKEKDFEVCTFNICPSFL